MHKSLFQVSSTYVTQVHVSHKHSVERSFPTSFLKKIGLEQINSLARPPCTAAESRKAFCFRGPQREILCEPASGVHHYPRIMLESAPEISFLPLLNFSSATTSRFCCLRICSTPASPSGKILYQSKIFVVISLEITEFYIQVVEIVVGP